jgi:hypothetical protein
VVHVTRGDDRRLRWSKAISTGSWSATPIAQATLEPSIRDLTAVRAHTTVHHGHNQAHCAETTLFDGTWSRCRVQMGATATGCRLRTAPPRVHRHPLLRRPLAASAATPPPAAWPARPPLPSPPHPTPQRDPPPRRWLPPHPSALPRLAQMQAQALGVLQRVQRHHLTGVRRSGRRCRCCPCSHHSCSSAIASAVRAATTPATGCSVAGAECRCRRRSRRVATVCCRGRVTRQVCTHSLQHSPACVALMHCVPSDVFACTQTSCACQRFNTS